MSFGCRTRSDLSINLKSHLLQIQCNVVVGRSFLTSQRWYHCDTRGSWDTCPLIVSVKQDEFDLKLEPANLGSF